VSKKALVSKVKVGYKVFTKTFQEMGGKPGASNDEILKGIPRIAYDGCAFKGPRIVKLVVNNGIRFVGRGDSRLWPFKAIKFIIPLEKT